MKNILFITSAQSDFFTPLLSLLQKSYKLFCCNSSGQTVNFLNDSKPDLILVDTDLPEKERILEIIAGPEWGSLPKLFFGNKEEELATLLDRAMGDVVLKSESEKMILARINKIVRDATEIQRNKTSLEQFKAIADFSSDMEIFRDTNNHIIYCSPSVEQILGYTPEEYINEFSLEKFIHPEDAKIAKEAFSVLMSGKTGSRIFRMIHKNGGVVWMEGIAQTVYAENGEFVGYRISSRDITNMRKMEGILKESEARYKLISDFSANWEVYRDINGKMVYCSPAVERVMGYTVAEFMQDIPFSDYIYHEDLPRAIADLTRLVTNRGVQNDTYRFIRKNGEVFYLEINSQAVYSDDNICRGFRLSGRDVTEKIELASELKKSNVTKDMFISIISHDLRSPFNALIGFSDLLCEMGEELTADERMEYSQILNDTAKNTLGLLDNLLLWSRSQSSEIAVHLERIDLDACIHSAVSFSLSTAQKKKIQLLNHLTGELFVEADTNMLDTVLRNLLSNAIKYTNSDGVISVSVHIADGFAEITVSDNGVGMTEEVKKNLFEDEIHQSSLGTASERGTGLGLLLCKEFVEKQGGRIWVESELGKGSVFRFTLPLFVEEHKIDRSSLKV